MKEIELYLNNLAEDEEKRLKSTGEIPESAFFDVNSHNGVTTNNGKLIITFEVNKEDVWINPLALPSVQQALKNHNIDPESLNGNNVKFRINSKKVLEATVIDDSTLYEQQQGEDFDFDRPHPEKSRSEFQKYVESQGYSEWKYDKDENIKLIKSKKIPCESVDKDLHNSVVMTRLLNNSDCDVNKLIDEGFTFTPDRISGGKIALSVGKILKIEKDIDFEKDINISEQFSMSRTGLKYDLCKSNGIPVHIASQNGRAYLQIGLTEAQEKMLESVGQLIPLLNKSRKLESGEKNYIDLHLHELQQLTKLHPEEFIQLEKSMSGQYRNLLNQMVSDNQFRLPDQKYYDVVTEEQERLKSAASYFKENPENTPSKFNALHYLISSAKREIGLASDTDVNFQKNKDNPDRYDVTSKNGKHLCSFEKKHVDAMVDAYKIMQPRGEIQGNKSSVVARREPDSLSNVNDSTSSPTPTRRI